MKEARGWEKERRPGRGQGRSDPTESPPGCPRPAAFCGHQEWRQPEDGECFTVSCRSSVCGHFHTQWEAKLVVLKLGMVEVQGEAREGSVPHTTVLVPSAQSKH